LTSLETSDAIFGLMNHGQMLRDSCAKETYDQPMFHAFFVEMKWNWDDFVEATYGRQMHHESFELSCDQPMPHGSCADMKCGQPMSRVSCAEEIRDVSCVEEKYDQPMLHGCFAGVMFAQPTLHCVCAETRHD
jgi:hypothetical protein